MENIGLMRASVVFDTNLILESQQTHHIMLDRTVIIGLLTLTLISFMLNTMQIIWHETECFQDSSFSAGWLCITEASILAAFI